jgi:hypothetical protein
MEDMNSAGKNMTEQQANPSTKDQLAALEQARDLFARAHDYIAQAQYQGHMGMKVAEVLNFLKFQYDDFKRRTDSMAGQIEQEEKAKLSHVDMSTARAAVDAVLVDKSATPASLADEHGSAEAPKA